MQITYNGKTYISAPKDKDQTLDAEWGVQLWIASGILKELEENNEKPLILPHDNTPYYNIPVSLCGEPEEKESWRDPVERIAKREAIKLSNEIDKPILEKLKEELKRRILQYQPYNLNMPYLKGECQHILDFLNSLSDKQEKPQILGIDYGVEGGDKGVEVKGYRDADGKLIITSCEELKKEQGQSQVKIGSIDHEFTPGQMIEVSQDGEKWEKGYFVGMADNGEYRTTYCEGKDVAPCYTKYARPIEKKKELPDFNWAEVCDKAVFAHKEEIDQNNEMIGAIGVQVEAITRHLKARDNK